MAYFEPYIDTEGIHIPTYDDLMEYLTDRYRSIFGADVYLGEETPDYQMMSVFAKCLDDYLALAVDAYNARDPYFAEGNSLDIIVQTAGMIRKAATKSTVTLTVEGDEGTEIPAGSKAIDQAGYIWTLDSAYTIPSGGTGTIGATCDTAGAIGAVAGTISGIYTPVLGWDGVTNAADATKGLDTESDAELRIRFAASHSYAVSGLTDSIVSALARLSGVTFVGLVSNDTGTTGGNGISGFPAHSFCAIVEGGDDMEIATQIFNTKSPGVGTYGSTTKTVYDDSGNAHSIKFSHPTAVPVTVNITVVPLPGYTADEIDPIIKSAIINDINALGIGKNWSVTMGYKDVYSQFSGDEVPVSVTSITASRDSETPVATVVECDYDEILTATETNIVITVDE